MYIFKRCATVTTKVFNTLSTPRVTMQWTHMGHNVARSNIQTL